jgi:DNA invertase Pin-like site-specific DNA recombinase
MKIGYARVSTRDQNVDMQMDALKKAGCEKIYADTASGAKADRPALDDMLLNARDGDVIVVWKLDRLGRSLAYLVWLVSDSAEATAMAAETPYRERNLSEILRTPV